MILGVTVAVAAVGLVGVWLVASGFGRVFQGKIGSAGFRTMVGGLFAAAAAVAGLFGLNARTYDRLTTERPVAVVELRQTGPQEFDAVLRFPSVSPKPVDPTVFALRGDSVRLEARIVKLQPAAVIAGADTWYRIDQISGRYDDADQGRVAPPSPYNVVTDVAVDLTALPFGLSERLVRDVAFGSGAFAPMIDGAVYEFRLTEDAMIVRGYNELGRRALRERA